MFLVSIIQHIIITIIMYDIELLCSLSTIMTDYNFKFIAAKDQTTKDIAEHIEILLIYNSVE